MSHDFEAFTSTADFVQFCAESPAHDSWNGEERSSRRKGRKDFTGTDDFAHAVTLATEGWSEGLDKLSKSMAVINSHGRTKERINDVAGDFPDVGRFLAGVPACMTRRVPSQGKRRPIVDIVLNATYNWSIKKENIIHYGAAVATLVDDLENHGFSVCLKVGCTGDLGDGIKYSVYIDVKRAGEALEMDKAVFFIAHPALLRRLVFSYLEIKHKRGIVVGGYGVPKDLPKDSREEGALYFGINHNLNADCATPQKALAHVRSIVRQQRPDLIAGDLEAQWQEAA